MKEWNSFQDLILISTFKMKFRFISIGGYYTPEWIKADADADALDFWIPLFYRDWGKLKRGSLNINGVISF